jgi:hypothetical protein
VVLAEDEEGNSVGALLTHWVVPTCLLASANETRSGLEVLRAEQTPLIAHCNDRSKNGAEQANQSKKTHDG